MCVCTCVFERERARAHVTAPAVRWWAQAGHVFACNRESVPVHGDSQEIMRYLRGGSNFYLMRTE